MGDMEPQLHIEDGRGKEMLAIMEGNGVLCEVLGIQEQEREKSGWKGGCSQEEFKFQRWS